MAAANRTVEMVEGADAPIVGLGLSGIEGSVPEGEFRVLREAADKLGLSDWPRMQVRPGDPRRVWAAIDDLGADRIGHGVASARDAALARLAG